MNALPLCFLGSANLLFFARIRLIEPTIVLLFLPGRLYSLCKRPWRLCLALEPCGWNCWLSSVSVMFSVELESSLSATFHVIESNEHYRFLIALGCGLFPVLYILFDTLAVYMSELCMKFNPDYLTNSDRRNKAAMKSIRKSIRQHSPGDFRETDRIED